MAKHGEATGDLGQRLHARHTGPKCHVYHDHGDSRNRHVAAIKAYFDDGGGVKNRNCFAKIDLAIIRNDKVVILAEIEEQTSSPKKILGDIMAVMMSNRISILLDGQPNDFQISDMTKLFVVGGIETKGSLEDKILLMQRQLHAFPKGPNSIDPRNVHLLFRGDLKDAITEFEALVAGIRP